MRLARCSRLAVPLSLVLVGLAAAGEFAKEPVSEIRANVEAKKAVLVDVREKEEWDRGHVEGAVPFPTSGVADGLSAAELAKLPKDKVLYVHCVVGMRAMDVADVLKTHGFTVRPIDSDYKELVAGGFAKAKE